jgi:hypothetical protein
VSVHSTARADRKDRARTKTKQTARAAPARSRANPQARPHSRARRTKTSRQPIRETRRPLPRHHPASPPSMNGYPGTYETRAKAVSSKFTRLNVAIRTAAIKRPLSHQPAAVVSRIIPTRFGEGLPEPRSGSHFWAQAGPHEHTGPRPRLAAPRILTPQAIHLPQNHTLRNPGVRIRAAPDIKEPRRPGSYLLGCTRVVRGDRRGERQRYAA